jgi:ribosomal protein S6--L-glutamate ligase
MMIGLITTRKKSGREGSVMEEAARHLDERGVSIDTIHPDEMMIDVATIHVAHDLYILKAGTPAALSLAGLIDLAGGRLLNPYPVVTRIKDKVLASRILADAGVPTPETFIAAERAQLLKPLADGPLIAKPFIGGSQGRGVEIVRNEDDLSKIAPDGGIIFAQRYYEPDGRDHKIYRIGEQLFGVRRVWPARTLEDKLGEPFVLTAEMSEITRQCGQAFGIDLYGLDIIFSGGRPFVVDINTFPGFKGVPEAGRHLADYICNYC